MTSFYDADGNGILTAAGTLFHVVGSGDAIKHAINEYKDNPGINDGDQFLYMDPYIAGTHIMDQIVVRPIFHGGKRIAWVATMTHTGDIGGLLRGVSKEIYHEGIRFPGIKIFEAGKVRKDIMECITQQCRDPEYVSIDFLARVAANNVCTDGFLRLVEKLSLKFVKDACEKIREDFEKLARQKLKNLPDGTWRQRVHVSTTKPENGREIPVPLKIECALKKYGERLYIDLTGTSPQNDDYRNATLAAARSCMFAPLCSFLFYDIPWNAGMIDLIDYYVPEGSFLNCRFPASCGLATECGINLIAAVSGCVVKMLYAAGLHEYVNSCWAGKGLSSGSFGPGVWYGGHSQHGGIVGMGIYDLFAGCCGATPQRDGVDTGGIYVNPTSCISDGEYTEMYWPLLFLARRHGVDSGGYGKFRGGLNLQTIAMVYGSQDLTTEFLPGPEGGEIRGFGLFGGYPIGNILGDSILCLTSENIIKDRFSKCVYPVNIEELEKSWGVNARQDSEYTIKREMGGVRADLPEYSLLGYTYGAAGGYGDPLDRDPIKVVEDIKNEAITLPTASKIYGVVIDPKTFQIDIQGTTNIRDKIREQRLRLGERIMLPKSENLEERKTGRKRTVLKISEYLKIIAYDDNTKIICCTKCENEFCSTENNYKKYALRIIRDISEMKKVADGAEPLEYYQEYICPGCGTLLQVDTWCPLIDSAEPVWDIDVQV
jgi:N-methylhydantoinase B